LAAVAESARAITSDRFSGNDYRLSSPLFLLVEPMPFGVQRGFRSGKVGGRTWVLEG
jgi:hypothetical protein